MVTRQRSAQQTWAFVRSLKIYRPYADEVPWPLFDRYPGEFAGDTFEQLVQLAQEQQDQAYLRVAKRNDEAIGAYLIRRVDQNQFLLEYLAVAEAQRHQGLGRWLTGHAIGIAESKGARRLTARSTLLKRFLMTYGFVEAAGKAGSAGAIEQSFEFTPE